MIGKHVLAVAGLILLCAFNAGAGQSGDYIGLSSGLFFMDSTLTDREGSTAEVRYDKPRIPVSAYCGRQFGFGVRGEGELFYRKATADELKYGNLSSNINSKISGIGLMGNVYYEFFHDVPYLADGPYSPYIGLGAGLANVSMSTGADSRFNLWNSDNDTVIAYQAAIGSSIPVARNVMLDVSYRYFGTTEAKIDQVKTHFNSNNFLLGVRYTFR